MLLEEITDGKYFHTYIRYTFLFFDMIDELSCTCLFLKGINTLHETFELDNETFDFRFLVLEAPCFTDIYSRC